MLGVLKTSRIHCSNHKAGPFCGSFLRKGEVFAYVWSIQNPKDLTEPSVDYVAYAGFGIPTIRGVRDQICTTQSLKADYLEAG